MKSTCGISLCTLFLSEPQRYLWWFAGFVIIIGFGNNSDVLQNEVIDLNEVLMTANICFHGLRAYSSNIRLPGRLSAND